MKFYRCDICGQIIMIVEETGVPLVCCGEEMETLVPGMTDGAHEKHVPVYEIRDGKVTVTVGSTPHPMSKEHSIEWIAIQTDRGWQMKTLTPEREPKVCFRLCEGEKVIAVYAYCNLHGLWQG